MIYVQCYSCGASRHEPYATENGCTLVKCSVCGLLYVNPRPSDNEIQEGVTIGAHKGERTLTSTGHYLPAKVRIYKKVLKDIYQSERWDRTRIWLDVGCGHGELLVALKRFFKGKVACKGLEPNRYKISTAHKKGLDVEYYDLATRDECYDVISLLNVYSHVPNPREFLQLIKRRLKPRGELLLETGDTANLHSDQHPRPFLLPDHLSFGSQEIIGNLLKDSGFHIVSINKYPADRIRLMKRVILKNAIKACLSTRNDNFFDVIRDVRAAKYRTDMWIRAKVSV